MTEWNVLFAMLADRALVILIFAVIDAVLGVIKSLNDKTFQLERLAEFLVTFAKWTASYAAVEILSFVATGVAFDLGGIEIDVEEILGISAGGAFYGVLLKYGASIAGHISNFLPQSWRSGLGTAGIPSSSLRKHE